MKISVIMPVYNTEKFVGEATRSILNQSFKDFEFIIVDDCSTDGSYEICKEYARKDKRIKLYRNKKNMGVSFTRNRLIELSKTNYIATQDSDDISKIDRFELEYNFLDNNLDYGVVSGNNIIINEDGKTIGYRKYCKNINKIILKKSPISNASSMIRKDLFLNVGGYDKNLNYAEDYDLWLKFYSKNYKIKNLNYYLLKYRLRKGQIKSNKLKNTIKNSIFVQKRAIKKYGIKSSFSDKIYHFLEKILLFIPENFILWLFKKLEYNKN